MTSINKIIHVSIIHSIVAEESEMEINELLGQSDPIKQPNIIPVEYATKKPIEAGSERTPPDGVSKKEPVGPPEMKGKGKL